MERNNTSDEPKKEMPPPSWPFFIKGRTDVVFFHIPKTAGTSMRWTLDFNRVSKERAVRKHNDAHKIIGLLGKEKWKAVFKFTFVRNPWDRLLSFYHFRFRNDLIKDEALKKSFKKWATHKMTTKDLTSETLFNLQPQTHWLKDKNGKIDLDFIGRFEYLERDFNQLTSMLSLSPGLLQLNVNPLSLDYQNHYDERLKRLVAEFYKEDIDYFKYTF
jgi:chondroitin 4-sulfotransferase 11